MADKLNLSDVGALERSLNESAVRVSTIWVSYLIFGLYLVVAAGGVTDRQLFLEESVKLPVLNMDLPLRGFFYLAPILFVIFHCYVLLQVLLLGRTAAAYNEIVDRLIKPPPANASARQRLANTLFAQIFAGSPREREGLLGGLLKLMAWVTLVIAPLCILSVFQFVFLPYHSHLVTWTHRILILVDLAIVFVLWPLVLDARKEFYWTSAVRQPASWVAMALFILISLSFGTFPGEPHVNLFTGRSLLSVQCERWLPAGFDRLDLSRLVAIDHETLAKLENITTARGQLPYEGERTRKFRGRDLSCGNFSGADLRRVDLTAARMFEADLRRTELQGALLDEAQLQGALLEGAKLQGASLVSAQLQGASLRQAKLQGALLEGAQLQGALLEEAQMQGALLRGAQLQGASLRQAQLQGALLEMARLQGADLFLANLGGAVLALAQLQGAVFDRELHWSERSDLILSAKKDHLYLTYIPRAYLWGARVERCNNANIILSNMKPIIELRSDEWEPTNLEATQLGVYMFIEQTVAVVPDAHKEQLRRRLTARLIRDVTADANIVRMRVWSECEKLAPLDDYEERVAIFLRELACGNDPDQRYITEAIYRYRYRGLFLRDPVLKSKSLARGLLGIDKACPGAKDLNEQIKGVLRADAATP